MESDVGIAYIYIDHTLYGAIRALQFWIIQLATQCGSLPSRLLTEKLTIRNEYKLPGFGDNLYERSIPRDVYLAWEARLRLTLTSLFTKFKRTFLLIDGLHEVNTPMGVEVMVRMLQEILEQDFGNVSIGIFSRPASFLDPLLQLADVSIRLAQFEPDLSEYIRYKVGQKVKPMLVAADMDHDENSVAAIEKVMGEASAGL